MSKNNKPETQYYPLCEESDTQDIVDFFKERFDEFAFPKNLKFYFQANTKQKNNLIKISKIPDNFQDELKSEILVQVNPEYFDVFGKNNELDNINEILFDREIDKIQIDGKSGKVSIKSRSLKSSKGIIDKFNYDDVSRAEEIESLYEEQKKDEINN